MRSSVEVHNALVERDVPHEILSTRGRMRAPERFSVLLGLPPQDVAKVVVLESDAGPVAAVVPAGLEPDPSLVAAALGLGPVAAASPTRASELSGYLMEAMPPAGLPRGFRVVIDRSLDRDAVLYFPGGEPQGILKVRGHDLIAGVGARVADIARTTQAPDEGA